MYSVHRQHFTWLLYASDSWQLPDIPDDTYSPCNNYNKSCHGSVPVQYNVCWLSCDQTYGPLYIRRKYNADMSTIAARNCRTYSTSKTMPRRRDACVIIDRAIPHVKYGLWENIWLVFIRRIHWTFYLLSASLLCYARTEKCMDNIEWFNTEFLEVGFEMLTRIVGHVAHERSARNWVALKR